MQPMLTYNLYSDFCALFLLSPAILLSARRLCNDGDHVSRYSCTNDMTSRQAACDPCRRSKLACDHKRPICTRCEQSHKASLCSYRAAPFQRRRSQAPRTTVHHPPRHSDSDVTNLSPALASSPQRSSPDSRHLGILSHVAIFNQISPSEGVAQPVNITTTTTATDSPSGIQPSLVYSETLSGLIDQVSGTLKQFLGHFDLTILKSLINFWVARGISLALAQPILKYCVDNVDYLKANFLPPEADQHTETATQLLRNSLCSFKLSKATTLDEFAAQFCGPHTRWEALGIFFSAVIRATFDVPFFPQLYTNESEKMNLRMFTSRLNKKILELCLSLDSLNDMQLIFQYENWIAHSYVEGDHNLSPWRSLGDAIASLFALGYHENVKAKSDVPTFLIEIRRTAFARLYSADKNVAIFLGRPPRICKRFCYFQVPSAPVDTRETESGIIDDHPWNHWPRSSQISYASETRWSALCAAIKEDILEFLLSSDRSSHIEKAQELWDCADIHWQALPDHFRLEGSLRQSTSCTPFERDFLASARLNYLHVQFLLRLGLLTQLTEPDGPIIDVAARILSLVVEIMLMRDHLANSGTGLTWKIAHYGLPAAGILLLAMLNQRRSLNNPNVPQNSVWQDLNVLAREVQIGSIISPEEPNYALLFKATSTIQTFLESVNIEHGPKQAHIPLQPQEMFAAVDDGIGRWSADPWNLEDEFWQALGEYPFFSGPDTLQQNS